MILVAYVILYECLLFFVPNFYSEENLVVPVSLIELETR